MTVFLTCNNPGSSESAGQRTSRRSFGPKDYTKTFLKAVFDFWLFLKLLCFGQMSMGWWESDIYQLTMAAFAFFIYVKHDVMYTLQL